MSVTPAQLAHLEQVVAAGSMAIGVVHEVKNPLMGIVGFAQLGQGSSELEEMREYFGLIEQDARRANALLVGLLDFTRPTSGEEFLPLELNSVVEGALRLVRAQLELSGVILETKLGAGLRPIQGDAAQLTQVLINVLLNANHALAQVPVKRVVVSTSGVGDGVVISVCDSGPGLTEEAKRRVFTPFFTTKARGEGTGLGLSISKRIIEAHGGTLQLENASPGAIVTITLPLRLT